MLAVAVNSSSRHALLRRRQTEKYLQNCSGAPRVSSSQLSTCSALQNSNQPMGQQEIQIKHHSPDEWASCLTSDPKKELTIHVRRLCCSRAPQAVQQRVPLDRASVTRCSAAWSMAPADYTLLPLQKKKYVPERPGNRTAK